MPGTENDDHDPPRVAPCHLVDVAIGDDNLFHGDKYRWSAQLTAINVTNKVALYNFLSTFSGTRHAENADNADWVQLLAAPTRTT